MLVVASLVLESMPACESGLNAQSNLPGSPTLPPLFVLPQRYDIQYWEMHQPCWLSFFLLGKAIKPTSLKPVKKYEFSQAPSNLKHRLPGSERDSRTGVASAS